MSVSTAWSKFYARWQIRRAIAQLDHPAPVVVEMAQERLRNASPACWSLLRPTAFRRRTLRAVRAAVLLHEMGDVQGLYALLEQYADRHMGNVYGPFLREALRQVGPEPLIATLHLALNRVEKGEIERGDWGLSLAVYVLHSLRVLQVPLEPAIWQRVLTLFVPGFEDLRVCRSLQPLIGFVPLDTGITPDWYEGRVGNSIAAVRLAAIEALLLQERERAFDYLHLVLQHPSPEVQFSAIYGLRRLAGVYPRVRDSVYMLIQPLAANRQHPLHRDARRALEAMGGQLPEALLLVRGSQATASPNELLRPASSAPSDSPDVLLRPSDTPEERQ